MVKNIRPGGLEPRVCWYIPAMINIYRALPLRDLMWTILVNTWSRSRPHLTVLTGTPVTANPHGSRIVAGHRLPQSP